METNLKAFMAENAIKYTEAEFAASKRFVDEDGEPIMWRLRILPQQEFDKLRQSCRKRVIDAKTRAASIEMDADKLNDLLVEKCIVYPNLNDAALQESYGAIGAVELAKTMLLPGEYADLMSAIVEAHGFESDMKDKIKLVKN